jgi:UTP--glucose-1-phosphate uridylyltransferase
MSVRQSKALGLGHAVLCAKNIVGDEDFAVALPDVLLAPEHAGRFLKSMVTAFEARGAAQILVEQVPMDQVNKYGIADTAGEAIQPIHSTAMASIVEKPPVNQAPSNWAVTGRYVLPNRIMKLLETTQPGAGGEIQLTDAIFALMAERQVDAFGMQGNSYDCGDKLGYVKASVEFTLAHPDLGADYKNWLSQRTITL